MMVSLNVHIVLNKMKVPAVPCVIIYHILYPQVIQARRLRLYELSNEIPDCENSIPFLITQFLLKVKSEYITFPF
jgi:hypothetical protein